MKRVARMVMFGGFLRAKRGWKGESAVDIDWTNFFHNVAVDAEPYFLMSPELMVPSDQFREFMRDARGCVMGRKLAEKFGWKIGDHFFLENSRQGFASPTAPTSS